MGTVHLSIGTPKTGTTAVQTFLRENEELLHKQGYCFPDFTSKFGNDNRYKNRNGHFLIFNEGNVVQYDEPAVQAAAFQMLRELTETYTDVVLSDEEIWKIGTRRKGFWQKTVKDFQKIGCELKVIVYLRRQDLFIQSLYNQNVKSRFVMRTESFDEYMTTDAFLNYPLDYFKHLSTIADAVGKENLIVRPYERGQFEGNGNSIFSDFLQCIGLTLTESYTKDTVKNNMGLRENFLEIKRILNGIPEYIELNDFMNNAIKAASDCTASDLHSNTSMFTYEQLVQFMEKFEESNRKTAEIFLDRPDGRLFYDPIEELPVWKVNPDTMYRDIILLFTEVFCQQQQEIQKLKSRTEKLRSHLLVRAYRKLKGAGKDSCDK